MTEFVNYTLVAVIALCNVSHTSCIQDCMAALSIRRRPSSSTQRSSISRSLMPLRTSSSPSQSGTVPSSSPSSSASCHMSSSTSSANRFCGSIGSGTKACLGAFFCRMRVQLHDAHASCIRLTDSIRRKRAALGVGQRSLLKKVKDSVFLQV
jgi:hypothetical protein